MSISEVIHALNILYHKEPGRPIYDKELPALKKQVEVPVEKKETEEEYIARLSKELPVLTKPEVEKKESLRKGCNVELN